MVYSSILKIISSNWTSSHISKNDHTYTVIILEFLTHGPMAQQSKNPGPYSQGHGTARHPPPKSILSILGPRRIHSLEASFLLWKIKLTSIS